MEDWKVISAYSRAQAIADGVLVDATVLAKETGFRFPVAVTAGVWSKCITVPEGVEGQDERGRLWDLLTMLRHAFPNSVDDRVDFGLHVRNEYAEFVSMPLERLYALCGPGDDAEPVITVMLKGED